MCAVCILIFISCSIWSQKYEVKCIGLQKPLLGTCFHATMWVQHSSHNGWAHKALTYASQLVLAIRWSAATSHNRQFHIYRELTAANSHRHAEQFARQTSTLWTISYHLRERVYAQLKRSAVKLAKFLTHGLMCPYVLFNSCCVTRNTDRQLTTSLLKYI